MAPPASAAAAALAVISLLHIVAVDSHVSLTYPPARKYALDFLDTFR